MNRRVRPVLLTAILLLAASTAGAQTPKWPSSRPPRPLAASEVRFPSYEIRTLPNGLQVVVVPHDEQPEVSLRLIVRAGAGRDPANLPGVASMVATLLDQGTTSKTASQVADCIDSVGGQLETGVGRDLIFAHVVVMKDSLELGMGLLADVVRHPAFSDEELERQRQQTLSALQVSYQDPEWVANVVFDRLVYGTHPYGSPGNGTPASIRSMTRDDVYAFHRRYFHPNNALLAVVGDVTTNEAVESVTRAFGDWAKGDVPPRAAEALPEPAPRVVVLDKQDAVQTEIRVGHLGIPRKSADYMAVDLAIKILGGAGANRLHRVLRTERGLTYGASAETETLQQAGEFMAQTSTRSEATGEVLRLIADEFARLRREQVNDRELSDAKAYLAGHFPLTIETPDAIGTQVLDALFYDLPLGELQTFRQRVNGVSADDVSRVAWKYLRPDRLSVVLVGNAAVFADQLRRAGFGKYDVVRLSDLDLTTADLRRKDVVVPTQVSPPGLSRWPAGLSAPSAVSELQTLVSASPGSRASSAFSGDGASGASAVDEDSFGEVPQAPQPQTRPAPPVPTTQAPPPGTVRPAPQPPPGEFPDTAEGLILRAIAAKGGLDRLKSVKTITATTSTTLTGPRGAIRTETLTYIQYPDHFRVEASAPVGRIVQVYAGEKDIWTLDPKRGLIEPSAEQRHDFKASVDRDVLSVLLRVASGAMKARLLDAVKADGKQQLRAVEVSGEGFDSLVLYIDGITGLVAREAYLLPGGAGRQDEEFSDYRDVNGLKVAFRAQVTRNGLTVAERRVSQIIINTTLKPDLFIRPQEQKK